MARRNALGRLARRILSRRGLSPVLLPLLAGPALADGLCRTDSFEGTGYALCQVPAAADLRLWLTAPDGKPVATFERLQPLAEADGARLLFAMNAGMYHPDRRPVGLYVEAGQQQAPLILGGDGNFGMLPNGVFCVTDRGFRIVESRAFAAHPPACRIATQSGPMLVIDGALHPRFQPGSTSVNIRNGVGVSADGGTAWFAISDTPVNFDSFARFFRDHLGLKNALYLDGSISRLYAPGLGRADGGLPMGPIVGVVAPRG